MSFETDFHWCWEHAPRVLGFLFCYDPYPRGLSFGLGVALFSFVLTLRLDR